MLNHIRSRRLSVQLSLLTGAFLGGFALVTLGFAITLTHVRVSGPLYVEIAQGKELISDVRMPPQNIIESYLVVLRILEETDPAKIDALIRRGEGLRREFETRLEHWRQVLPPGAIRAVLFDRAVPPALAFYELRDGTFVSSIRSGDRREARRIALGELAERFEEHESAVTDVVRLVTQHDVEVEAAAEAEVAWALGILGLLAVGITIGAFGLASAIGRGISGPIGEAVAIFRDSADGDLTKRWNVSVGGEICSLATSFNAFLDRLSLLFGQVQSSTATVAAASQQLVGAVEHLSSGSQEQAASLEETAASLGELTASVRQTSEHAARVKELASESQGTAEGGLKVVGSAVASMQAMTASSKRIAEIIATVDEIAFQTNLLSLNAAVEAARAGENGRGFAVVASEVRNLAQRSSSAAREIKVLIHDTVERVAQGSALVDDCGETFERIVAAVRRVGEVMPEVAAAAQEQAMGIEEVNRAVSQIDTVVQSTASQAEELSATAQSLSVNAIEVQRLMAHFRLAGTPERNPDHPGSAR